MKIILEPEIRDIEERTVAAVSFVGNYIGNPAVFERLFNTLFHFAGPRQLIQPETVFLSAYYDDPDTTPPEDLFVDVCMTIGPDVVIEADQSQGAAEGEGKGDFLQGDQDDLPGEIQGGVQKKQLPGGRFLVMRVELSGPEEYAPAWYQLVESAAEQNLELDLSRPGYEIYLNSPNDHPEKHHIVEISLGLK